MLIIDDKGLYHIVDFKTKRVRDDGSANIDQATVLKTI